MFPKKKALIEFAQINYTILSPIPQPRNHNNTFLSYDKLTIEQTHGRILVIVVRQPKDPESKKIQNHTHKKTTIFSKALFASLEGKEGEGLGKKE